MPPLPYGPALPAVDASFEGAWQLKQKWPVLFVDVVAVLHAAVDTEHVRPSKAVKLRNGGTSLGEKVWDLANSSSDTSAKLNDIADRCMAWLDHLLMNRELQGGAAVLNGSLLWHVDGSCLVPPRDRGVGGGAYPSIKLVKFRTAEEVKWSVRSLSLHRLACWLRNGERAWGPRAGPRLDMWCRAARPCGACCAASGRGRGR